MDAISTSLLWFLYLPFTNTYLLLWCIECIQTTCFYVLNLSIGELKDAAIDVVALSLHFASAERCQISLQ